MKQLWTVLIRSYIYNVRSNKYETITKVIRLHSWYPVHLYLQRVGENRLKDCWTLMATSLAMKAVTSSSGLHIHAHHTYMHAHTHIHTHQWSEAVLRSYSCISTWCAYIGLKHGQARPRDRVVGSKQVQRPVVSEGQRKPAWRPSGSTVPSLCGNPICDKICLKVSFLLFSPYSWSHRSEESRLCSAMLSRSCSDAPASVPISLRQYGNMTLITPSLSQDPESQGRLWLKGSLSSSGLL